MNKEFRKIVKINPDLCNGCGICIPNCPEGSLQIIDNKATLVSELSCDGLGACVGECPVGAISIEERLADSYDEITVLKNIIKQGENTLKAHLHHLDSHNETIYLNQALAYLNENNIDVPNYKKEKHEFCSCPSNINIDRTKNQNNKTSQTNINLESQLRQWPIQLSLVNPNASFFKDAELLVAADCAPFSYANFHNKFLKNKVLVNFCPKLDANIDQYIDKLSSIFKNSNIKSITIVKMEVPCCNGTTKIVEAALKKAEKNIIIKETTISLDGNII